MSWIDRGYLKLEEDWTPINPRVVVCAPPEDHPFWKARLESLGVKQVDLHRTHRDALNELHRYHDAVSERNYHETPDGLGWTMIMLFDDKIEWAPDFSEKDEHMFCGSEAESWWDQWTSITDIGDNSYRKVTYKSSDRKLVDLLAHALNSTQDSGSGLDHVYKPKRRAGKGKL